LLLRALSVNGDSVVTAKGSKRLAQRRLKPTKAKRTRISGKRRSVWLEGELYEQLVRLAKAEERTLSYLMRRFIKRGVQAELEKPS
jgi:ribosomal protein S10